MKAKSPFLSKTLWVNLLAIVAMVVQSKTGYIIDAELQVMLLTGINLILRAITKQPLVWSKDASAKAWIAILLLAPMLMFMPGCAAWKADSKTGNATRALLSMQTTIIGVAESADQLCSLGQLDQEQCDQIAVRYQQTKAVYDLAATSLATAIELEDDATAWQRYQTVLARLYDLYRGLTTTAAEFGLLPQKGGAPPPGAVTPAQ